MQEVLLRAKPAVALVVSEAATRVTLDCGAAGRTSVLGPARRETGTGWVVAPSGWIITSAHLVAPRQPEGPGRAGAVDRPGCRRLDATVERSLSVTLSNGTQLPARVVKLGAAARDPDMASQDLALLRIDAHDLPSLSLSESDPPQLGDPLHIVGFPSVVLIHELLRASATVEASVTTGAVSGFREDPSGRPLVQTDAAAESGSRGAPAVSHQGEVIGVLTALAPGREGQAAQVQGFNFVIPADEVRRFLAGAGVPSRERSAFDAAWQEALERFFTGDHRGARRPLEEARRLLPGLPDIARLQAENEAGAARQPLLPWRLVGAGLTGMSLVGYGAIAASRLRRNRFRITPGEAARLLDAAAPPILLDVRAPVAYDSSPVQLPNAFHVSPERLERGDLGVPVERDRMVIAYCT